MVVFGDDCIDVGDAASVDDSNSKTTTLVDDD